MRQPAYKIFKTHIEKFVQQLPEGSRHALPSPSATHNSMTCVSVIDEIYGGRSTTFRDYSRFVLIAHCEILKTISNLETRSKMFEFTTVKSMSVTDDAPHELRG